MKHQNGMHVPTEAEQAQMDIVADDLDSIEGIKRDLAALIARIERNAACLTLHVTKTQVRDCAELMEEALDDLLQPDWIRLSEIECAMGRSAFVPSFVNKPVARGSLPNPHMRGFNANRAARDAEFVSHNQD